MKPSKLPEPHEIKSFKDVVNMYNKTSEEGVNLKPKEPALGAGT